MPDCQWVDAGYLVQVDGLRDQGPLEGGALTAAELLHPLENLQHQIPGCALCALGQKGLNLGGWRLGWKSVA